MRMVFKNNATPPSASASECMPLILRLQDDSADAHVFGDLAAMDEGDVHFLDASSPLSTNSLDDPHTTDFDQDDQRAAAVQLAALHATPCIVVMMLDRGPGQTGARDVLQEVLNRTRVSSAPQPGLWNRLRSAASFSATFG